MYLIKGGTIITASETYDADILIDGEKIHTIGEHIDAPHAEVIPASGKYILPGGVDPHTHFDLPMFGTVSSDDHYTGHKAAAFGGTTTVIDFVPQDLPTLQENVDVWRHKADKKAAIDYSFHMNITSWNDAIAREMVTLPTMGITSIKVFTAYNGRLRLSDGEIFHVLRLAKDNGLLTMVHAENGDVIEILINEALAEGHLEPVWHARTRPAWGAVEAVLRSCALAAQAEAPVYIVHMNTAGGVDQLAYARSKGILAMGETCPQYLFFTEEHLERPDGSKWVCSPPVRTKYDNNRLWEAIESGVIQTIGTDHCPFFYDGTKPIEYEGVEVKIPGKELGIHDFTKIPNGLPGVQDRLPVLWTKGVVEGRITPNQFVSLTSTNPAKIFGLYPKKGAILPGSDADIVIWDPNKTVRYGVNLSHHRTDYNLYEGWVLQGYPERVFLRGKMIVDRGEWLGNAGFGQFIYRSTDWKII